MPLPQKISRLLALLAGCFTLSSGHAEAPKTWQEPTSGMEFVWIAKGCFQMGAKEAGPAPAAAHHWHAPPHPDEVPRHEVCLDGFWIARHEVTRDEWNRVMRPQTPTLGRKAMTSVSFHEAQAFAEKLSAGTKEMLRLPTEAEWEYACLAGTSPKPYNGDDQEAARMTKEIAWYSSTVKNPRSIQEVGERKANAWGLHDMLGNAWEWVQDGYADDAYAAHSLYNPVHMVQTPRRVLRGGSFRSNRDAVRCGERNYAMTDDQLPTVGFRLVRVEKQAK